MTAVHRPSLLAFCRCVVAASFLIASLASCAKSPPSEQGVVVLDGEINDRMRDRLVSQTTAATRLVLIRSGGGQVSAALDMADFILEKKLSVQAFDFCMSACAAYVWMAGADRRIAPDTLLAFHGGQASHLYLYTQLRASKPRLRPPASLITTADREDALYRRLGIDREILFASSYLRDLRCGLIVERANDGFQSLLPVWSTAGTLPTMSFLSSYGVLVAQGSLPETQADLDRAAVKLGNSDLPRFVLTLPEDEALTLEQIKSRLPIHKLKECDPSDPEIATARAQRGIF